MGLLSLHQVPLPKPRQKTHLKESRKVTFVSPSLADETQQVRLLHHPTGLVLTLILSHPEES